MHSKHPTLNLFSPLLQHIQQLNPGKPVCLSGYSFGASVAYEMCLQAESSPKAHPRVGSLVLLDGSPALVTSYTREHKAHFTKGSAAEEEAQALCSFVLQFVDVNMREVGFFHLFKVRFCHVHCGACLGK